MEREPGLVAGSGGAQPNAPADLCLDHETTIWGFRGRITRKEYWKRLALAIVVPFGLLLIFSMVLYLLPGDRGVDSELTRGVEILAFLVGGLFVFFVFWFSLATQVKRWHDVGRSGWMVLPNLVPYIGLINVVVAGCVAGTKGSNRYGTDPMSPEQTLAGVSFKIEKSGRAIVAAYLIAIITTILFHWYYQFLIFHQHRGERALAHYRETGKVDAATFGAFGYNGLITTMDLPLDDNGSFITNVNQMKLQDFARIARNVVVEIGVEDAKITPVTFDLSYVSRMVVTRHALTWFGFGTAFVTTLLLALVTPRGRSIVSLCGWFSFAFGMLIVAGTFVLKGYLGLDGLGRIDYKQTTNIIAGPLIVLLGMWLINGKLISAIKS